jgi:hypothetical protein
MDEEVFISNKEEVPGDNHSSKKGHVEISENMEVR